MKFPQGLIFHFVDSSVPSVLAPLIPFNTLLFFLKMREYITNRLNSIFVCTYVKYEMPWLIFMNMHA